MKDGLTELPDEGIPLEVEARVVAWIEKEDAVPEGDFEKFFNDDSYCDIPEEIRDAMVWDTRLGSVPSWIQSAQEGPEAPLRFVGQLGSSYSFYCPPPSPDEVGCSVGRRRDGKLVYDEPEQKREGAPSSVTITTDSGNERKWGCEGPNFGDMGMGYIFVRTTGGDKPEGRFFWQCS